MAKKKKRSFREWLIHKLGGYVLDPYDGYPQNYWIDSFVEERLYVSNEHCRSEYIESLENEFAGLLAKRLIEDGYVRFRIHNRCDLTGHKRIYGGVNILKLRETHGYNYPNRLTFENGEVSDGFCTLACNGESFKDVIRR